MRASETVRGQSLGVPQRWTAVLRALDPRVLVPALALCAIGLLTLAADRPAVVAGQARWMLREGWRPEPADATAAETGIASAAATRRWWCGQAACP